MSSPPSTSHVKSLSKPKKKAVEHNSDNEASVLQYEEDRGSVSGSEEDNNDLGDHDMLDEQSDEENGLSEQALEAYREAQNRAGVIYISRIPPGMSPDKVRHLMSAYGEIGKVFLQQEGTFGSFPVLREYLLPVQMPKRHTCVQNIVPQKRHTTLKDGSNFVIRRLREL